MSDFTAWTFTRLITERRHRYSTVYNCHSLVSTSVVFAEYINMSDFSPASVNALKKHLVCDSCNPATAPPTILVSSCDSPDTASTWKPDDKCDDCHRNTYLLASHLWSIAAYGRERQEMRADQPRESEWPSQELDPKVSHAGHASKSQIREFDLAMSD